ncbi:MAG: NB-ARC domain-containing protein,Caspase domain-containing protein, partial [Dolichospermum sp.]|nr:NB-ARC domain-containing protein,Caspase domain-containing protein [Dolichospermum sp.]
MSSPDPQKTYAVVVGIEKYDKSPKLPGAASSSLKFAKWLNNQGVPHDNIFLFISESDDNKT